MDDNNAPITGWSILKFIGLLIFCAWLFKCFCQLIAG